MKIKCIKHIRKTVNGRYIRHQEHLGINHATSDLLQSNLADIIFLCFKRKKRGILDQSRP